MIKKAWWQYVFEILGIIIGKIVEMSVLVAVGYFWAKSTG